MLFKTLAPLVAGKATVALTVSRADAERLRVTITPYDPEADTPDDGPRRKLEQPIAVTGTPDELDVDLCAQLEAWSARRSTMAATFTSLEDELAAAEKELRDKIAETKKKAGETKAPAAAIPKAATLTPPPELAKM